MEEIIFRSDDLLFEPVLAMFSSWIGYCTVGAKGKITTQTEISGRLRGVIIPHIEYENSPVISNIINHLPTTDLKFTISRMDPGPPKGEVLETARLMEFWCQQMTGHSYELACPKIMQKFTDDRKNNWPSELQFFYHIRNGCFHKNKFNIKKNSMSTISAKWEGREIIYADNGKQVAGKFMWPADFICLLWDIQKLLN